MIKILCFFIAISSACTNKKITYVEYNMINFKKRDSFGVKIIDYRLPEESDFKDNNYASLYICYDYMKKKTIKVVSSCENFPFEMNALVVLSDCSKSLSSKNIMVASDSIFEEKYKNLHTVYAGVGIPID